MITIRKHYSDPPDPLDPKVEIEVSEADDRLPDGRGVHWATRHFFLEAPIIARLLFEKHNLLPAVTRIDADLIGFVDVTEGARDAAEIVRMRLGKHDPVIFRTPWLSFSDTSRAVDAALRKGGWEGHLFSFGEGIDLYALPEDEARRLFEAIKRRWGWS